MQIKINTDNSIIYECSIKGEGGSLFTDIGDNYITGNADVTKDLDFSAYNHTYDRPTQIFSRGNAGAGFGYIYGPIERSMQGTPAGIGKPASEITMRSKWPVRATIAEISRLIIPVYFIFAP